MGEKLRRSYARTTQTETHQHIARRQVAVDHASRVQMRHAARQILRDAQQTLRGAQQRLPCRSGARKRVLQMPALGEFLARIGKQPKNSKRDSENSWSRLTISSELNKKWIQRKRQHPRVPL